MSVNEMFHMADSFFTSVGLKTVTQEFWDRSMLEKPADGRDVVCHASAWDFSDGVDFRIKQCTRKNMEDFITVHHELGHIQYYLQYKDLLYPFRQGANPGFHEAVGDVLALSVSTPKHLKAVNLIESYTSDNNSDINYLMGIALEKIVFLPFGKLMDDYRWSIFDGTINPSNLNAEWWKRRCRYQGVSPPVERTEQDFDAGAKYHIPANVPYVRLIIEIGVKPNAVANITAYGKIKLSKTVFLALCESAGQTGPLHTCDIYNSRAAGEKLGNMLKLGSSRDWQDALEAITGNRSMSAEPILEYFKPLIDWLNQYNSNIPDAAGWEDACPTDIPKADTAENGNCDPINSGTFISLTKDFILLLGFLYCLL